LKKGQILNFIFTGQPPSEYSIDPGKLVGALWGIFSTQIDPGLARKIAAGLASKRPEPASPTSWTRRFSSTWGARSQAAAGVPL
jgi:hypothetical protein